MTHLFLQIHKTISWFALLTGLLALTLLALPAQADNQGLPTKNKGKASARMTPTTTVQSFTYTGQIETWIVPENVYFLTIEARGGEGGTDGNSDHAAGKGAIITGTVPVIPGTTLKILVGQKAPEYNSGGGGSFVTDNSNAPLVIAGGGGGSGMVNDSDEKHGRVTTSGGTGAGGGSAGGTAGKGGNSTGATAAAGGGLLTDGQDGEYTNGGGKAFINGGTGGSTAGFGGGGMGSGTFAGGGGGGYSGGGSASSDEGGVGGGGGSYNAGTNPSSLTGAVSGNSGHGMVIFSYSPCTPFTATLLKDGDLTCSDNSVLLTVSGEHEGATFRFSDGTHTSSPTSVTASVITSGVYSVTVTNPDGCSSTATVEVTSDQQPVAPTLSANVPPSSPGTFTAIQNTPSLALSITGCEGGALSWQGPNGTSGTSSAISVPTSATGTLVYSATCTIGSCPSPPGSATVIVSSPSEIGSFDGFIYGADCATFRGWAWDRNKPNTVQSIQILDGPKVIATLLADVFRQDLQTAGKGNGKHAFFFTIPTDLKDGKSHYLSARIKDSGFILKDSPKVLICEGIPVPGGNKPPVPPSPTVLVTSITAQVGVPFSGTLVPFTDPEGGALTYKLSGLPGGLSINETTRVISGTPAEAGTYLLAYSATDPGLLTNSVSFSLTITSPSTTTVTGSFEGYLDKVECGTIRGWVWDRNKPNTPLTVEFYTGTTVWGSVVANIYRDDLKNAGKGNGAHAYSFTVPSELKDGNTHLIRARVSGSTYDLKDSGKPLTCASPSPVRLSAETGSDLQVTLLGNPVSDRIEVEVRGSDGKPLRFQLTDASGRLISQRQIEVAKPVEQQTFSVSQQPAGLFLLRVNSGLKSLTLKVMKQ